MFCCFYSVEVKKKIYTIWWVFFFGGGGLTLTCYEVFLDFTKQCDCLFSCVAYSATCAAGATQLIHFLMIPSKKKYLCPKC